MVEPVVFPYLSNYWFLNDFAAYAKGPENTVFCGLSDEGSLNGFYA